MASSSRVTASRQATEAPRPPADARSSARVLALPYACAAALIGFGLLASRQPPLFRTFVAAGVLLLAWSVVLHVAARRGTRVLAFDVALHKHHWMQACAQGSVLLYWGWHVRFVYAFLPLVLAQLIFAYAVDSLLTWSRRDRYALGFGPFPVILSINLFLWFRPEWFHWQLAMIAVGYAAKEFIRWNKDGRSAHIFNPSSFPLAVFSLGLILTGTSDITLGTAIASSQFYPPHIYLVIFLAALPGQLLFGVARMTMPAVVTMYAISLLYLAATGTYLFYDVHIPIAIFLGMHLLFCDPSTSPRSQGGRIAFGVLYAIGTTTFYVILASLDIPTFYDKLLPVPLMNLLVRRIDRLAAAWPFARLDSTLLGRLLAPRRPDIVYVSAWAGVFVAMSALHGVGGRQSAQALPFWREACAQGSGRACEYTASMTSIYCSNGSGWACNELGIQLRNARQPAGAAFARGCDLGFAPACENADNAEAAVSALARAGPRLADLPIVLRGTKPPLVDRTPAELQALACEQGWPGAC